MNRFPSNAIPSWKNSCHPAIKPDVIEVARVPDVELRGHKSIELLKIKRIALQRPPRADLRRISRRSGQRLTSLQARRGPETRALPD